MIQNALRFCFAFASGLFLIGTMLSIERTHQFGLTPLFYLACTSAFLAALTQIGSGTQPTPQEPT